MEIALDKKFEPTNESKEYLGVTLYRIKALKDFGDVKAGELGGFVEKEDNLSQKGDCWIYNNAMVYGNAKVYNNAKIYNDAKVYDNAQICGNAQICDDAIAYKNAIIHGNAKVFEQAGICGDGAVFGDAMIFGNVRITGRATVYDNASIYGDAIIDADAIVFNNAIVCDEARVFGDATVFGNAVICDNAIVCGHTQIYDNTKICDSAKVYGKANVCDNAIVNKEMEIYSGKFTINTLSESIRCQTNLAPCNGEVIAYKRVSKDLNSLYDPNFKYVVGEWAEVKEPDISDKSCASGLHFSNATYWDNQVQIHNTTLLIAKIKLEDIIAVQRGKIRCKRAFIMGTYDIVV